MPQRTARPTPGTLTSPALQAALDDLDRATSRLQLLLDQHPDHAEAPKWRALLDRLTAARGEG